MAFRLALDANEESHCALCDVSNVECKMQAQEDAVPEPAAFDLPGKPLHHQIHSAVRVAINASIKNVRD